jgi:predicted MFS family arabinose efflux permease
MRKRNFFALTKVRSAMTPSAAPSPADLTTRGRLSPIQALWLYASIMVAFFAASTAPSPLYALYREAWGFSALALTLVFAVYAFALLGALLVLGKLSDHRGRREVLLGAMGAEIASVLLFRHADSIAWLFAARALQGAATGVATSALSAGLLDLDRPRGASMNSVAPLVGMAIGALGAGALAEFAPAPTRLVFDVLLGGFVLQALLALRLPETVSRQAGALASLRPRLAVPPRARATLWAILPINTALWALGGFYSSLGPSLARIVSGAHSPTLGGAVVAALVLSGAAAIPFMRSRSPRFALAFGASALVAGVALTLAGMQAHSIAAFCAGSVIAGTGFGAAFNGAVRSLVPLAEAHERAGLMSTFYVLSYLAFSLPAMAAGLGAGRFGLQPAALGYGLLLIALGAGALAIMALRRRPAPA